MLKQYRAKSNIKELTDAEMLAVIRYLNQNPVMKDVVILTAPLV